MKILGYFSIAALIVCACYITANHDTIAYQQANAAMRGIK